MAAITTIQEFAKRFFADYTAAVETYEDLVGEMASFFKACNEQWNSKATLIHYHALDDRAKKLSKQCAELLLLTTAMAEKFEVRFEREMLLITTLNKLQDHLVCRAMDLIRPQMIATQELPTETPATQTPSNG